MARADIFLKLDGIMGESRDQKHGQELELLSYSFGAANQGTAGTGGGAGASKVSVSDFSFHMTIDKASPNLFKYCANGKHIGTVTMTQREAGETPQEYLVVTMTECLISSFHITGTDGGGKPAVQGSLNFAKIKFDYKAQKADGSLDASINTTVSVAEGSVT